MSSADLRRARALADAAEWAVRMSAGPLTDAEQGEFVDWLRESPVHVAEMLRIGRVESTLATFDWDSIPAMAESYPDHRPVNGSIRRGRDRFETKRRVWLQGLAATLLIACIAGLLWPLHSDVITIYTQSGERREITLADGSVVDLSPNTALHIRFSAHLRSVLIDRGESSFHVAKNPSRPFVVRTPEARVQAVGTVFSVARNADSVVVTVTEGQVRVSSGETSASARQPASFSDISLRANEQVSVSSRGTASSIRQIAEAKNVDRAEDSWVFEDARVSDVVARFNDANRLQIRIADRALLQRTVSGVFKPNDPESFIDFLEAIAGATRTKRGDEVLVTTAVPGTGGEMRTQ